MIWPYRNASLILPQGLLRLIVVLALVSVPASPADFPVPHVKRVLLISDFNVIASQAIDTMEEAIVSDLKRSPYRIEFYSESLETALFPDEQSQSQIRADLLKKYVTRHPDLVIAIGPFSLQFVIENHERSFPDVPVVFCGSASEMLPPWSPSAHFTGVWGVPRPDETLKLAITLKPSTKHVFVVGGQGNYDRTLEAIAREAFRDWKSSFDFNYLTELDMPTLLDRLKHLPDDSIIYYTSVMLDAAGNHFVNSTQSVPMVASAANAPIFVVSDANVKDGTVGGAVLSFAAQGNIAGDMALRILNGANPSEIPIQRNASIHLFDWNALHKWNLKHRLLPADTQFINRRPSVWDSYGWYIVGGLSIILTEFILIVALLWHRRLRRKVELRFALTNERFRMAMEAGKAVGWDLDLIKGRNEWFGDLESMFGMQSKAFTAGLGDFGELIYKDDREAVFQAISVARQNRSIYSKEFRVGRLDGTIRWISATGEFVYSKDGQAERMVGMAVDITDRKLAAEKLSYLTARLMAVQEEERRRIAREIHDDFQQRLAMIHFDLHNSAVALEKTAGSNGINQANRLRELATTVKAVSTDMHSLSHRLHPAVLENLGLVAAVEAFCEEFSAQQQIGVRFTSENVPRGTTSDTSICVFRVVQEALRNVKKHSGSASAEVRLEGVGDCIQLTVSDQGSGFDASRLSPQAGIGIRSMEERLRLVGGNLRVSSRPGAGTRIEANVPVTMAS